MLNDAVRSKQQQEARAAAQNALSPAGETLQVDDSISSLGNSVEFLVETVQALLRRLEPVTVDSLICSYGVISAGGNSGGAMTMAVPKAPMALQLDRQIDRLSALTVEVQQAIRALQI